MRGVYVVKLKWIALFLAAFLFTGCLGGTGGSPTATVGLYMADTHGLMPLSAEADVSQIDEIWVTINRIEAKRDGHWEVIAKLSGGAKVNLFDLQAQAQLLVEKSIPAGRYSEFRLVLNEDAGANYVVLRDGTEAVLKVPSGKLQVKNVDIVVQADTVVELIFDINAAQFVARGENGFIVNPAQVLKILDGDLLGSLDFRLELPRFILEELDGVLGDLTVGFSVRRNGVARPFAELVFENGILEFSLERLLPGTYEVSAFVRYKDQFHWELEAEKIIVEPGSNLWSKEIPG